MVIKQNNLKHSSNSWRKYLQWTWIDLQWTWIAFVLGMLCGRYIYKDTRKISQRNWGYIMYTYPGMSSKTLKTIENEVIHYIKNAKHTLYLNGYGFTSVGISNALIDAYDRGVAVHILLDKSNETDKYSMAPKLLEHKISSPKSNELDLNIRDIGGIHHAKVMTIDDDIVILGSFNWTKGANTRNDEIVLFESNEEDVKTAREAWHVWLERKSHKYGNLEENSSTPWKRQHKAISNNNKIRSFNYSYSEPWFSMNTWKKLGNELSTMFSSKRTVNKDERTYRNHQQNLQDLAFLTLEEHVNNSKKRCYIQLGSDDKGLLTALSNAKQRGVDVIVASTDFDAHTIDIFKNKKIKYIINPKLKTNKIVAIIDDMLISSTSIKQMMNVMIDNLAYEICVKNNDNNASINVKPQKQRIVLGFIDDEMQKTFAIQI